MHQRVIPTTPRKGIVRLFALTRNLSEEDRWELLAYIGQIEENETKLAQGIQSLYDSLTQGTNSS